MKRAFSIVLAFISFLIILPQTGNADGYEGRPFTVEVILPDNNIGNVGHYHVPGKPGDKITLKAKLTNLTDKPLEINAVPLNSYSGLDGIFYLTADKVDSNIYSLVYEKYGVAQYVTVSSLITLQPKQSQEVEINVTVPDINRGTLLGSIKFVVFAGTQEVKIDNQNSSILLDKYQGINIGIQIDLPEKDQTSIKIGESDFIEESKSISVAISNEAAIIEENISGTYQVKDKQNNVICEGSISAFKMAPMTRFKYLIPWGDRPFEQGAYTLYFQLNTNGRMMNFEIPLVTEPKPIPTSEENTPENTENPQTDDKGVDPQDSLRTFFLIGLAGIIIIFGLFIFLSYKKSRKTNRKRTMQI